jgi:hypothetical protein
MDDFDDVIIASHIHYLASESEKLVSLFDEALGVEPIQENYPLPRQGLMHVRSLLDQQAWFIKKLFEETDYRIA